MGKLDVIKNEATKLVKDAISSMLGDDADVKVYVATNDKDWLDKEIEKCWSIQELLNDEMREVSDEEIMRKEESAKSKKLSEVINDLAKDMNKNFEKARDEVEKKQKQILVDSPVKVEKKETCGCGENCKCKQTKSEIVVDNAFNAKDLKSKKPRKLINVNKTVSKLLTKVFEDIKYMNDNGEKGLSFELFEEFEDELDGVIPQTIDKVVDRMAAYLAERNFEIQVDESEEGCIFIDINW